MTDRIWRARGAVFAALVFGGGTFTAGAFAQPVLDGPLSDHAVIQRDAEIVLSGSGNGDSVRVTFGDLEVEAGVGADGSWRAALPPMPAGGPYVLTLADAAGETRLKDILVGDVWLCSGQSNMAYGVALSAPPPVDLGLPPSGMRLLSAPAVTALEPHMDMPEGAEWAVATPETVSRFSAVCYFAARSFRKEDETPIGLINASWGGAQAEAFVPAEQLRAAGGFETPLDLLDLYRRDPDVAMAAFGEPWEAWWRGAYGTEPWTGTGEGWKSAPDEMADWKTYGDPEAEDFLGQVWYARTFTLTESQAAKGGRLALGKFDDVDASWLNGEFLGSTHSWSDPRTYPVAPGQLRAGENAIVINVLNTFGPGGMLGPAEEVALHLEGGETVPLAGGWRYEIVPETKRGIPTTPWGEVNGTTTIHNGMIAPLGETRLQAALWYQGESNVDHPETYETLLRALIAGWRDQFGADLPVAVVQLPNFGAAPEQPGVSGWAEVREAERRVAVDDPLTGLVVTIDVGDPDNLHPRDKYAVGERTAAVLRGLMDDADIFTDGVPPMGASVVGNETVVRMPAAGLAISGGGVPGPFALCGSDGDCEWAEARLDGDRIVLTGGNAAEIRYCWGDAPVCDLRAGDRTPVSPFRIAVD